MQNISLTQQAQPFLSFLDTWCAALPVMPLDSLPQPGQVALISVDVINGFCYEGPLASPRVAGIVQPITRLMERLWQRGVTNLLLAQDTHDPQAVEFGQWPPHCVRGTSEAEPVPEFRALPFFDSFTIFEKNSIASGLNTGLNDWLQAHPDIDTFIITGDCTDLCTYQLAMHLRLDANARQLVRRVVVPADCVQTYDRSVEEAAAQGGLPHPGDLLHALFLYHMQLNGVDVVAEIH